jgi:dihydroflavonol-4-reductase
MTDEGTKTKDKPKSGAGSEGASALAPIRRAAGRTLVTGATGFLGAHLVDELLRRGVGPLRTLQSGPAPAWLGTRSRLGGVGVGVGDGSGSAVEVEIMRGSVTSRADLKRALAGVSHVYHLAGFVSHKAEDAHRMYGVHVDGTRLLCEAAVEAGVERIVMSSTSGTIAVSRRADADLDEDSPAPVEIIGKWPYYASKLYQEAVARRVCGGRVELVTVNPSLLLGPGDDRLSSTRLVLQYLGREITLCPSGGLSFVDVRDVARVLPEAMERGRHGARYLLGAVNWTFAELFGRLERMTKVPGPLIRGRGNLPWLAARAQGALYRQLGRTPPVEAMAVEMASYHWYFESRKAAAELGFATREPGATLFDTVRYVRERFLGSDVMSRPDHVPLKA